MKRNRKAKILATLGPASSDKKIIQDSLYNKKMKEVVDKVNKSLSSIEQIRKFILIDHEFTIENNMMTPSMKVRRFKVKEMYGENLEKLY